MKLSLCLITFNEEKFIHIPLDSAYDIADEVVIVDGGSTDKTLEIAKKYGDKIKIFHEDNPTIFLINKQKAIEYARGEWILQLDADEALSPELKKELMTVIASERSERGNLNSNKIVPPLRDPAEAVTSSYSPRNDNNIVAYKIPRKNNFLGRYLMKGGVYPDYVTRLYKKDGAHFACKNVHENVIVKGEVGETKGALLHFADPDFNRYLTRWKRYTDVDAKLLYQKTETQKTKNEALLFFDYVLMKPVAWFFLTYFRHLGILDGWQGFVFHFMSSIRFIRIYSQYRKLNSK